MQDRTESGIGAALRRCVRHDVRIRGFLTALFVVMFLTAGTPRLLASPHSTSPANGTSSQPADSTDSGDGQPAAATSDSAQAPEVARTPSPAASPHPDDRLLGVLPNYATVEDKRDASPVNASQKFKMASLDTFDPVVYPFVGVTATFNHAFGAARSTYAKQYAATLADTVTGNFMTTGIFPSLLHQDPRYFQLGTGSALHRLAYAASRSLITQGDGGRAQFNLSEIGGSATAVGLSNLYYPASSRMASAMLSRLAMQVTWDTLSNVGKEFWPDLRRKLHRH